MDAVTLARYILSLDKGEESDITPMKLQKLMYFAHGYHLAFTGKPLVEKGFDALKNGPVNLPTYMHFKKYKASVIGERSARKVAINAETAMIIQDVFKVYNQYSAAKLSKLTHLPNTPWSNCFDGHDNKSHIPNDMIKAYFEKEKDQFIEALEDLEDEDYVRENPTCSDDLVSDDEVWAKLGL